MKTGNGKTGRPISFDKDAALEAAMLLFWERGYECTSMTDLTQAMSVNPTSIYAAIGDKRALLSLAVKRYMDSRVLYATKALANRLSKRLFIRSSTVRLAEVIKVAREAHIVCRIQNYLGLPRSSDPLVLFLKAFQHLGRCALWSTTMKDRIRRIFNRELDLLSSRVSS
jgi:AcrR family transcriptional regulator